MRRLAVTTALVLLTLAAPAAAQDARPNLTHVENLPTRRATAAHRTTAPTSSSRRSTAGSTRWPARTTTACRSSTSPIRRTRGSRPSTTAASARATSRCSRQDDLPGRTFATYTSDTFGDGTSTCYREAAALGFEVLKADGTGRNGTFIVDITDPLAPRTVSFVRGRAGLAQQDRAPERQLPLQLQLGPDHVDPAGDRGLRHLRPRARRATSASWRSRRGPGLGTESHDITFNTSGTARTPPRCPRA